MDYIKNLYYNYKKYFIISCSILLVIISSVILIIINKKYNTKKIEKEIVTMKSDSNTEEIEKLTIPTIENNDIKVDIKGEVINPGVYSLPEKSRVIDAIYIAGGLTELAFTRYINLSKILKDEMVIIINNKEEVDILLNNNKEIPCEIYNEVCICEENTIDINIEKNEEKDELNKLVNINTANIDELQLLNGIGESRAQDIIDYRNINGLFKNIEEIKNVSGIKDSLYEKIKNYITIE